MINYVNYNGSPLTSPQDIADALASTLQKHSSNKTYTSQFITRKLVEESTPLSYDELTEDPMNYPITMKELSVILEETKNSTPGPDDIPIIFLKMLSQNAKKLLLKMYNVIWNTHVFPHIWSESIIVPILKTGQPKSLTDSYIPISLTCAMCKLIEKIINRRLIWTLENRKLIIPQQSGFRKKGSTLDNLVDLESDVHEAFANSQECIAIFFDISKAYDTRSLIRSKLDYGSIVYNSAKNGTLKKLGTIQNCALRIALGAFHTSPVESLYCESGEPPLSIRRKHLSLTYAAAVQSNPDNPVFHNVIAQGFRNTFAKRKRVAIPFYERLNRFLSNLLLNRPEIFNTSNIPNPPPWTFPSIKIEKGLTIQIYTDASKLEEGVGAAFTSTASNHSFKLPAESTVFSGEFYAIWKALEYAEKSDHSKFLVITDSLSTLEAITKLNPEHPIILHIKHKLHSIIEKRKHIHFMWVPSHVGIAGNERADQLAKDAITNPLTDIEKRIAHPDLKPFYKQILTNVWQQQWNGSNSKLSTIKPLVLPWKSLPKTRKLQVILSRLRLGHTRFTHEYILNGNNPPTCEVCDCAISVKHILSECAS
ncbi:uncharacterized protein [Leptinotarsa decemlineata]|uniref:uncharacterized protein n=1 Tax=Leptinotarsa decemlineata TaxID=7539 RepID=UPI003D306F8E